MQWTVSPGAHCETPGSCDEACQGCCKERKGHRRVPWGRACREAWGNSRGLQEEGLPRLSAMPKPAGDSSRWFCLRYHLRPGIYHDQVLCRYLEPGREWSPSAPKERGLCPEGRDPTCRSALWKGPCCRDQLPRQERVAGCWRHGWQDPGQLLT